ncbi:chemotaxis protein CheA [uncultured Jatrophihabitans sp.]|uniref:chemotaxis protein CheA n=1 Tax=uncultured Jatrophihabitans sp. TaxID=1610747 RepID=UPI0035CBC04C
MNDEDDEIIQAFLVESTEGLDELDRDLVALEAEPGSHELLSRIFRTIHTIKGTSGFLAFGRLEQLTHVGENVLSRLRDGELTMTPPIAEALLHMVDAVRALLAVIEQTGADADDTVNVEPITAALRVFVDGAPADAADAPADDHAQVIDEVEEHAIDVADGSAAQPTPEPVAEPAVESAPEPAVVPAAAAPIPTANAAPPTGQGEQADARTERKPVTADASVRVDVELLDTLVRLVGELVLTRNQILQQADAGSDVELVRASQRLNLVASELQESVMRTRMQPIGQAWTKFPRVVRDLGAQLGKDVRLEMSGQETELDRSLLEAVKDPLTHLVRNSIDHGIETPQERVAAGKPAHGTLALRAFHESGQVVVEICDDGKGLDADRIGAVALQRGVVTQEQLARMTDREITDLVFRPGFSTAAQVTNVSGRGVGMDVVRTNIERIGGIVDLSSRPGLGTTVRVRIPLTLAIIPALVVGEGGERFAIPQANLVELVRLDRTEATRDVETLAGAPILRLRGQLLPLISLSEALDTERAPDTEAGADHIVTVVVVQAEDMRFGLVVDEVHDTQEIVVKPLGRQLKGIAMYAGATIMGDGRVALILDIGGLAQQSEIGNTPALASRAASDADVDVTSLLILDVGDSRRAALPLASVSRLEEFARDSIERSGNAEVVRYRDGILPLVRLADTIGLPSSDRRDVATLSVVVHEDGDARVGIVADRVIDVVEAAITANPVGTRPGVLGTAVVQDKITDLVDLDAVVAGAGAGR